MSLTKVKFQGAYSRRSKFIMSNSYVNINGYLMLNGGNKIIGIKEYSKNTDVLLFLKSTK